MSRFNIYHAHGNKLIGTTDIIEQAIYIGEQNGCRDRECPCRKYSIFDTILRTSDITAMVRERMRKEGRHNR